MGRNYKPDLDYSKALEKHYDAEAAIANMKELEEWMKIDANDLETRKAKGFDQAYNLTVWVDYPGDPSISGVLLQNLTFGLLGCGGGPTKASAALVATLQEEIKNV